VVFALGDPRRRSAAGPVCGAKAQSVIDQRG
jgi:hypothetical protein